MAKSNTELELQLRDARSRMASGTLDGEQYENARRLDSLLNALQALGKTTDSELYRHFPVAAVAVLESHFKFAVSAIVNSGSPYLERGLALAKDRIKSTAIDFIPLLHRKSVTVGELVAHSLAFNSLGSIEIAFDSLFGGKIKNLARDSTHLYSRGQEQGAQARLIEDVDALWKSLAETFERRHILAHEAATNFSVSYVEALEAIKSVKAFTSSIESILWGTVWKDQPLTQYEMNVSAWSKYSTTRSHLATSLKAALSIATEDGERQRFIKVHLAWKHASVAWTNWEEEEFQMGSIRPYVAAMTRNTARAERLREIDHWIQRRRPEGQQILQRFTESSEC